MPAGFNGSLYLVAIGDAGRHNKPVDDHDSATRTRPLRLLFQYVDKAVPVWHVDVL